MPQLDPTYFVSQLFWLVVSLTVLYVALARFILPNIQGILERREAARAEDLRLAQRAKDEAEGAKGAYEKALAEARTSAQLLFAEAELKHKQQSEAALAELNASMSRKMAEAEKRIASGKDQLMAQLAVSATELAASAAQKLTGKTVERNVAERAVQAQMRG